MSRTVSALFSTQAEAQAAADRLAGIGIDLSKIRIADQSQPDEGAEKPGFFDQLSDLLLSDKAATKARAQSGFLLTAEVGADQVARAASLIETGSISASRGELREQVFEFRETAEELVIGTEPVVREQLILQKRVRERVEQVEGTVRHTEFEIEEIPPEPRPFGGRTGSGTEGSRK